MRLNFKLYALLLTSVCIFFGKQSFAQNDDSKFINDHYNKGVKFYNDYIDESKRQSSKPMTFNHDFPKLLEMLSESRKENELAEKRNNSASAKIKAHYKTSIEELKTEIDKQEKSILNLQQKKKDLDKSLEGLWED